MKYYAIIFVLFLVEYAANHTINTESCVSTLVETIPQDVVYNETIFTKSTYEEWLRLINSARYSIDIASFYWTLNGKDVMPNPVNESIKGENILKAIIDAKKSRSVKIRIAVNDDKDSSNNGDLLALKEYAIIKKVNFTRLIGAGILHTKFIIIDNQRFYVGSANMDWRSLTHVKEMGIVMQNCSSLAKDLMKIFEIYWFLGNDDSSIPNTWPSKYSTQINIDKPLKSIINKNEYEVFITSSPRELCSDGRTVDIDAIVNIINNAEKFIYVAVMDYFPMFLYQKKAQYWPVIDNALKKAAIERNVQVRLLASHWNHTRRSMSLFLKSLSALSNQNILNGSIETRQFVVPAFTPEENEIPFARVNHNKYMVTDKTAYIGTSNWSADYFVNTGGVALVLSTNSTNQLNLHDQLKSIFERDWNSKYSQNVF